MLTEGIDERLATALSLILQQGQLPHRFKVSYISSDIWFNKDLLEPIGCNAIE